MAIQYVVRDHGGLVLARAVGVLTDDDLIVHEWELSADARVTRGYRQLLDCRWAVDDRVTPRVLDRLVDVYAVRHAKLVGARYAVVAHNPNWFQVGAQSCCEVYRMSLIVFNDPSTACIWLGVEGTSLAEGESEGASWLSLVPSLQAAYRT